MKTCIDLPPEQMHALQDIGAVEHLSPPEVIRRAIGEFITRHARATQTDDAAFGLWKGRSEDSLAYQQRLRDEWER